MAVRNATMMSDGGRGGFVFDETLFSRAYETLQSTLNNNGCIVNIENRCEACKTKYSKDQNFLRNPVLQELRFLDFIEFINAENTSAKTIMKKLVEDRIPTTIAEVQVTGSATYTELSFKAKVDVYKGFFAQQQKALEDTKAYLESEQRKAQWQIHFGNMDPNSEEYKTLVEYEKQIREQIADIDIQIEDCNAKIAEMGDSELRVELYNIEIELADLDNKIDFLEWAQNGLVTLHPTITIDGTFNDDYYDYINTEWSYVDENGNEITKTYAEMFEWLYGIKEEDLYYTVICDGNFFNDKLDSFREEYGSKYGRQVEIEKQLDIYVNKWYEDIGQAVQKTAGAWKNGVQSLFSTGDWSGIGNAFVETGATVFVVGEKGVAGVCKVGEFLVDGTMLIGSAIGAGGTYVFSGFNSKASSSVMDFGLDFARYDAVGNFEKNVVYNNYIGNIINENSNLKYNSAGANAISSAGVKLTEFGAATVITIGTAGTGTAAAVAGIGFVEGVGKSGEIYAQGVNREQGENYNYLSAGAKMIAGGIGKAVEWYGMGQMGQGFVNSFGGNAASGMTRATAEKIVNASPKTFGKALVKDMFTWQNFGETMATTADHFASLIAGEEDWNQFAKGFLTDIGIGTLINAAGAFVSAKGAMKQLDAAEDYLFKTMSDPHKLSSKELNFLEIEKNALLKDTEFANYVKAYTEGESVLYNPTLQSRLSKYLDIENALKSGEGAVSNPSLYKYIMNSSVDGMSTKELLDLSSKCDFDDLIIMSSYTSPNQMRDVATTIYLNNVDKFAKNGVSLEDYYKTCGIDIISGTTRTEIAQQIGDVKLYMFDQMSEHSAFNKYFSGRDIKGISLTELCDAYGKEHPQELADLIANFNKSSYYTVEKRKEELIRLLKNDNLFKNTFGSTRIPDISVDDMLNVWSRSGTMTQANADMLNVISANNFLNKNVATGLQEKAIYNYTRCGGFEINGYLNDAPCDIKTYGTNMFRDRFTSIESIQDQISGFSGNRVFNTSEGNILEGLDGFIGNSNYDQAMVVYRGTDDIFDRTTKLDVSQLKVGDSFSADGYSSSSILRDSCFDKNYTLKVTIPPNSAAAAYIENYSGAGAYYQMEVLIKRNATFTVIGDVYTEIIDGTPRIVVPVVVQ